MATMYSCARTWHVISVKCINCINACSNIKKYKITDSRWLITSQCVAVSLLSDTYYSVSQSYALHVTV